MKWRCVVCCLIYRAMLLRGTVPFCNVKAKVLLQREPVICSSECRVCRPGSLVYGK